MAHGKAMAYSAGTEPDANINPDVVKVMQEMGMDLTGQVPKALTLEMLVQVDKIITMGGGVEGVCPASSVPTEDWGIDDPKDKSIEKTREIRDEIKSRITKLLDTIE